MTGFSHGVWTASATPMNDDLSIHTDHYIDHIQYLLGKGSNGVALFGTTGEANSFSIPEKLSVLRTIAQIGINPQRLMVGTGCCAIPDTVSFTQNCIDLGFTNFLLLPPFYYKEVSEEGLFEAYTQTITRLPQTGISMIVYDIPQMSGVAISLELLMRLRDTFPEIIKGVKNSSGDWDAINATCKAMPDFGVFAGTEQYLLPTLKAGGAGCISATANVTSQKLGEIYTKKNTDEVDNLQAVATQTRLMLQKFPPAPALKAILAKFTGKKIWANIRPPLASLGEKQRQQLFTDIKTSGLILNENI